jgi:hypothetical protein
MTVGRPARLAWSLAGACVALVLSSLVLLLAASQAGEVTQYYYEDAAVAVSFALLGAVVAAHRPENPIGWLFLAIGLSGALGVVSNEYAKYTLVTAPGALPGGSVAAWLSGWTWWPAYGLVPPLPPVRHRPDHQPHPGLRAAHRPARAGLCGWDIRVRAASPPSLLWPPPPWPWLHCSSRPAAGFRPPLTAASTGPAMTGPGPWRRSVHACATRSTWIPSRRNWLRSSTRPCSRPGCRCGCALQRRGQPSATGISNDRRGSGNDPPDNG